MFAKLIASFFAVPMVLVLLFAVSNFPPMPIAAVQAVTYAVNHYARAHANDRDTGAIQHVSYRIAN